MGEQETEFLGQSTGTMDVSLDTILPPASFSSDPLLPPSSIYLHVPSSSFSSPVAPYSSTITTISTSSPSSVASFPVPYSVPSSFASVPSAKVIISSDSFTASSTSTSFSTSPSSLSSSSTKITISTSPSIIQKEDSTCVVALSTSPPPSPPSQPTSSAHRPLSSTNQSSTSISNPPSPMSHSPSPTSHPPSPTPHSPSSTSRPLNLHPDSMEPQTITEVHSKNGRNSLSDCESDEMDLMKVMMKKRREGEDDNDSALQDHPSATDEEDYDDDDDFSIHFAHSGRKKIGDNMTTPPELLTQITELQDAVVGMKTTLTEAVTRLGSVVEDPSLAREVSEARHRCQQNTSEVLTLVLSLKTDITNLQKEVSAVSERQDSLQSSLTQLLDDRRLLLADLSQAGVISIHTRSRLEGGSVCVGDGGGRSGDVVVGRSCSGSHSNDSGVALLLERAHQAFTNGNTTLTPSPTPASHRASDQDSLPDQPSLLVPPSVYDYVAGLRSHHPTSVPTTPHPHSHTHTDPPHSRQGVSPGGGTEGEDLGLVYDSDSSLTIAANKTLSLSTTLSQQCGMELRAAHTSTPYHSHQNNHFAHENSRLNHDSKCHSHKNSHHSLQNSHLIHIHNRQSRALDRTHTRSDSDGSDRSHSAKIRHRHCSHDHGRESGGDSSSDPYAIVVTHRGAAGGGDLRDPYEAQRYRVARELLDTEKKYCKTLWTIQDTFAEPLKKSGILSHKDISTLFPEEVYQLYDKHCLLQHQLRERLASWKWQPLVGDVLARFTDPRHTDVLPLYTAYVNEFPEVLKTFHKLCRASQPFTKFIKGCLEQPSCGGLDLGAFLLTPVQRVPRYILLLKQLLKATPPPHPDHYHLQTTLQRLRNFLARLNDSMEHSFQLVHAHLAPPLSTSAAVTVDTHHRPNRQPRRSLSSPASASPPLSPPLSPTYSPTRSSVGGEGGGNSPQRSHSCAAPPPRHPRSSQVDNRSSSLPRGSPSTSSGSQEAQSPSQELPRIRSRSESVASRRPRPAIPRHTHQDGAGRNLASALSVHDISSPVGETGCWVDLAASEPSLADTRPTPAAPPSLTPGHSMEGGGTGAPQVWSRPTPMTDDARGKKKSSLRTSIKNMFTFKKSRALRYHNYHNYHHSHHHHHHHLQPPPRPISRAVNRGRDEGDYWEGPDSTDVPSSTAQPQTGLSVVGDFVDEEGNPCSNV